MKSEATIVIIRKTDDGTMDTSGTREWEKVGGFWVCYLNRGNGICGWTTCGVRGTKVPSF